MYVYLSSLSPQVLHRVMFDDGLLLVKNSVSVKSLTQANPVKNERRTGRVDPPQIETAKHLVVVSVRCLLVVHLLDFCGAWKRKLGIGWGW